LTIFTKEVRLTVLPIYVYDQAVLRRRAKPVQKVDGHLVKTVDDMFETMRKANGIGLAANQVGSLQRIVVIDVSGMEGMEDAKPMTLLNPSIVDEAGEVTMEEGCLSLPDLRDEVVRPEEVAVEYMDLDLQKKSIEADGILARVLQHEIDHLNGVLFIDRLGSVRRKLLRGRLNKILKGEVETNYPIVVSTQIPELHMR
jgi:peptide deformylase